MSNLFQILVKRGVIVGMLFLPNLLLSQTSVYVCSETGSYGYCYGDLNNLKDCAYNNCVRYGGSNPVSVLFYNGRGYGAIALGTNSNGGQVVGASAGYETQADADKRAIEECQRRGGSRPYINDRFKD